MPGNRDRMIAHLEAQGATVRKTKKGLWIQTPKGTTSVHNTPSDRRAVDNEIAAFRRLGLTHPEDKAERVEYPAYITQANPQPKTLEKFRSYLHSKGWPTEVKVRDLRDYGDNVTVTRLLYSTGYRHKPGSRRNQYIWVAPEDVVNLHNDLKARADEIVEQHFEPEVKDPEPPKDERPVIEIDLDDKGQDSQANITRREDGSEFIDEHDSWTVGLASPDPYSRAYVPEEVRRYISGLRAAGLEVEIRVWRK